MKKALPILMALSIAWQVTPAPAIAEDNTTYIHVAKDGNAANSGETGESAVTIERMNELVKESVAAGKPAMVYFHQGEYTVDDTISLSGGSSDALVTYQAYEEDVVTFTGAKTLEAAKLSGIDNILSDTNISKPVDLSADYNVVNIYTASADNDGGDAYGAGSGGAYYCDDFKSKDYWKTPWSKVSGEYNTLTNEGVDFTLRVVNDKTSNVALINKSGKSGDDTTQESIRWKTVTLDKGRYKSVDLLMAFALDTADPWSNQEIRLNYAEGEHQYFKYTVPKPNAKDIPTDAKGAVILKGRFNKSDTENGKMFHYSIPTDSNKVLESISIMSYNCDYDSEITQGQTNDPGYKVNDTTTTGVPKAVNVYAITGVTQMDLMVDEEVKEKIPAGARENVLCMDLSDVNIGEHTSGYYGGSGVDYHELFVNGEQQILARYPNISSDLYEYLSVSTGKFGNTYETVNGQNKTTDSWFIIDEWENASEKAALWKQANDYQPVRLHGFMRYDWAYGKTYITDIDPESSKISIYPAGGLDVGSKNRFYVADLLEELDAPGEWFIDRAKKILYFYPPEEFNKESDELKISELTAVMFSLNGCSNVKLEGLTFEDTRGRAIVANNSSNITIDNCTFNNIGYDAIYAEKATDFTLSNSTITNTGARGIFLDGGDSDTLTRANNFIINNTFVKNGQLSRSYHGAVSVRGCGNTVANNTMKNTPHEAIGYGGTYQKILNNDIQSACTEAADMGAIYGGRDVKLRGNEIAYNYIHDIVSTATGNIVMGVYLDDALTGQRVHHNIIKNVNSPDDQGRGILINGGSDTSVHDNIILDCPNAIYMGETKDEERYKVIWRDGIDYAADKPEYLERFPTMRYLDPTHTWAHGNFIYDNLIVNSGCQVYEARFVNAKINEGARSNRRENNVLVESFSGFVDAQGENYEIKSADSILTTHPNLADIKMGEIGRLEAATKSYPDTYTPKLRDEVSAVVENMAENLVYGDYSYIDVVDEYLAKAEVNEINVDDLRESAAYTDSVNKRNNYYDIAKLSDCVELEKHCNIEKPDITEESIESLDIEFLLKSKAIGSIWTEEDIWKNINVEDKRYETLEILANSVDFQVKLRYTDDVEVIKDIKSTESKASVTKGGENISHYSIPLDRTRKLSEFSIIKNGYIAGYDEYGFVTEAAGQGAEAVIYAATLTIMPENQIEQVPFDISAMYNQHKIYSDNLYDTGYFSKQMHSIYYDDFIDRDEWKYPWNDGTIDNIYDAQNIGFKLRVSSDKNEKTVISNSQFQEWMDIPVTEGKYDTIEVLVGSAYDGEKYRDFRLKLNYADGLSVLTKEYKLSHALVDFTNDTVIGGGITTPVTKESYPTETPFKKSNGRISHLSIEADNDRVLKSISFLSVNYDAFESNGVISIEKNDLNVQRTETGTYIYAITGVKNIGERPELSNIRIYNKDGTEISKFYEGGNSFKITADVNGRGRTTADIYIAVYDEENRLTSVKKMEQAEKAEATITLDKTMNADWKLTYFAWKKGEMTPFIGSIQIQ